MANIEVLKQLRRVAEEAPEDRLHMTSFVDPRASCGTARCLLGWAIVDPWFQKNTRINDFMPADYDMPGMALNTNKRKLLREIFDIDGYDQSALFAFNATMTADPHAVTKAEILGNIDALIAGGRARRYEGLLRY